ncbi:hypothetical protein ABZ445_34635 [Streptomyces chartreusis]|uniref:hypothetical protein n=1 Tax=Streptomyces chartreusis TaxID=1969 RepID=UPI0033E65BFB
MSDMSPDAVQIRITPNGICFIDEEYFTPPPGVLVNEAVLAHLQLDAAALGVPIRALVHDEQAHYVTAIQVNADGTSNTLESAGSALALSSPSQASVSLPYPAMPLGHDKDPVPADRPYMALPEPYRERLLAICATANRNLFAEAARDADQLLADLSSQFGPSHLFTLAAGLVRGDIAWLDQDFRSGLHSWVFMARAWHLHLGSEHGTTLRAVNNALGCWRGLQLHEAKEASPFVVDLLQDVSFPNRDAAERIIDRRTRGA